MPVTSFGEFNNRALFNRDPESPAKFVGGGHGDDELAGVLICVGRLCDQSARLRRRESQRVQ